MWTKISPKTHTLNITVPVFVKFILISFKKFLYNLQITMTLIYINLSYCVKLCGIPWAGKRKIESSLAHHIRPITLWSL